MSETQLNSYSVSSHTPGTYTVTNAEANQGLAVIESLSNGDEFVFEGKIYTYEGGADSGGQEVGFFALDSHGNEQLFTTGTLNYGEQLTLNAGQSYWICFMAGTRIATPDGAKPVETLAIGDIVTTADGKTAPVRWIGRQTVATAFVDPLRSLPIRIKAGALAVDLPARDLLVSPAHAILLDGVLVQAGALVNGASIVRETEVPATFVYYHVELDDHALILAESVAAETFVDNIERAHFDNWEEHERLYPQGHAIAEMPYARACSARQVPQSTARRLTACAQQFAGAARDAA